MHIMDPSISCDDLDEAIDHYTNNLGYRLEMISPADAPREALVSKGGEIVRLKLHKPARELGRYTQDNVPAIALADARAYAAEKWITGRAGMEYRNLIPGRLGGRLIASHIRLAKGGEVADYVHYHKVDFQMIYCLKGSIKVVYEDQGEPFWLNPGDCVLQPPEIRHRVLECTAGAEVIEIGMPAVHETCVEHDIELPTGQIFPERDFSGQRFVRHIGSNVAWEPSGFDGFEARDTRISEATDGVARVRILRSNRDVKAARNMTHVGEVLFFFVIISEMRIGVEGYGEQKLAAGDSIVIPSGAEFSWQSDGGAEILTVSL